MSKKNPTMLLRGAEPLAPPIAARSEGLKVVTARRRGLTRPPMPFAHSGVMHIQECVWAQLFSTPLVTGFHMANGSSLKTSICVLFAVGAARLIRDVILELGRPIGWSRHTVGDRVRIAASPAAGHTPHRCGCSPLVGTAPAPSDPARSTTSRDPPSNRWSCRTCRAPSRASHNRSRWPIGLAPWLSRGRSAP